MTVRYGYQPMHQEPLAGPEKVQQMHEKLAKRVKVSVAGVTERAEPGVPRIGIAPTPVTLEWLKPVVTGPGTASLKSACGRFRIDKVASQLSVGYTCWKLSIMDGELHERLGCTDDPDEAKALCEGAR